MAGRQWLMAIALAFCLTACLAGNITRCELRLYHHTAEQKDTSGKRCWGQVQINVCGGYCLSHEVPHHEFPYKKSHHPVCSFKETKQNIATLRNCDSGVDPSAMNFYYLEAASCICKKCSSDDTSCDPLPSGVDFIGQLAILEQNKIQTFSSRNSA